MNDEQRQALTETARFLDLAAGDDIGCGHGAEAIWAVDVIGMLTDAFGIKWEGDFAEGVLASLTTGTLSGGLDG